MIEKIKKEIKNELTNYFNEKYQVEFNFIVEEPKKLELGDISIPVFGLIKLLKKPLPEITSEIKEVLQLNNKLSDVSVMGGFVNAKLNKITLSKEVLNEAYTKKNDFGTSEIGKDKTICIDYSSPNIAKNFTFGHLRSTMIGNALKNLYKKGSYNVVSINHLGDWGTQFGKLIVAYKLWGNEEALKNEPINELSRIYVKFHEEAEKDPSLEDEGRKAFKELENRNEEYMYLWDHFRNESLKEFEKMYNILGVKFDSYNGEAFYNDKMHLIVNELKEKNLLEEDQGANVVRLGEGKIPALIERTDGATLYITRDLAAVFYRKQEYNFDKCIYVVGNEQALHFEQLKGVIERMGYDFYNSIEHVNFGLVLKDGKKMSSRNGKVVKLIDVINEATELALKQIEEKNPTLENKEDVASSIGVGAIVFNDLKNDRRLDYEFDLDLMLKFEGQTGPYLQYSAVRISSILNNNQFDINNINEELFNKDHYFEIIKQLSKFKETVEKAISENAINYVCKYLLGLSALFNRFYSLEKILSDDEKERNTNLALIYCINLVLEEGLKILGIKKLERM